LNVDFVITNSY